MIKLVMESLPTANEEGSNLTVISFFCMAGNWMV